MSHQQHFYSFINWSFNNIDHASLDPVNMLFAAISGGNVAVWSAKNGKGRFKALILPPIKPVDLRWIYNTNLLAIIGKEVCVIWDIEENKVHFRFEIDIPIRSIAGFDSEYLVIYENSTIEKVTSKKRETTEFHSIWINQGRVYYRSKDERFTGDFLTGEEYIFRNTDDMVKKKFHRTNKECKNINIVSTGFGNRIPDLGLHPSFYQYIKSGDFIVVHYLGNAILFQTRDMMILKSIKNKSMYARINHPAGFIHKYNGISIIQHVYKESISTKDFLRKKLVHHIKHTLPEFENAPDYTFHQISFQFPISRNDEKGFLLFNDERIYYILDLFKGDSMEFPGNRRYKNNHYLIDEGRKFILEWRCGSTPPRGELVYRSLQDNFTRIIYNIQDPQIMDIEDFIQKREVDLKNDLIIPEWHSIELSIQYRKEEQSRKIIARSQLYFMVERLSRSQTAARLNYDVVFSENMLAYGDVKIKNRQFFGIHPVFGYDDTTIVTCHLDDRCYIWNDEKVPEFSFPIELPVLLQFSERNIALITFQSKEHVFIGRDARKISSLYPHATMIVYDRVTKQHYQKTVLFPTHLTEDVLSIELEGDGVQFTLPSPYDRKNRIIYHYLHGHFSRYNPSKMKRYWFTHSTHSKLLQKHIGVEYIIDPHPEIRSHLLKRPFTMYIDELVRKTDDLTILAGVRHQIHPQISTNEEISARLSTAVKLPYPGNRYFKIQIKKFQDLNVDRLALLENNDELPRYIKQTRRELDTRRGRILLDRILKDKQKHGKNGILF